MTFPVAGHGIPNIENYNGLGQGLTRRVGAGGVKSGLPLLITGGKKRYDEFHWLFNTFGRVKKKPQLGELSLKDQGKAKPKGPRQEFEERLRYCLPRSFCPDCAEHDRPSEQGMFNLWCIEEPIPGLDLRPGHVVVSTWCQECLVAYRSGKIRGTVLADGLTDEARAAALNTRMEAHTLDYLRAHHESCLPSQELANAYKP